MEAIKMKTLLEDSENYPDAGAKLYDLAYPIIQQNEIITIDMTDVSSVPSMFMNMSFARLISDYGKERVLRSFSFKNITKSQIERFKKYFNQIEV